MNELLLSDFADKLDELHLKLEKNNCSDLFQLFVWKSNKLTRDCRQITINDTVCNTAACAIGWFPILMPKMASDYQFSLEKHIDNNRAFTPTLYMDKGERLISWDAVQELFSIPYETAFILFGSGNYKMGDFEVTPDIVAERIRMILNGEDIKL